MLSFCVLGSKPSVIFFSLIEKTVYVFMTEYCELYAKREHILKTLNESSDEEISDGYNTELSDEDDGIAAELDP